MELYYAQTLGPLFGALLWHLKEQRSPFGKSTILVPNLVVKQWLSFELAKESGALTFGLDIALMKEGFRQWMNEQEVNTLPAQSDLTLTIEMILTTTEALKKHPDLEPLLFDQNKFSSKRARLLARTLAQLFDRRFWQETTPLGWQEIVWNLAGLSLPLKSRSLPLIKPSPYENRLLFGAVELAPLQEKLFRQTQNQTRKALFLLSPSYQYLGDLSRPHCEILEQNPLLASWGEPLKRGAKEKESSVEFTPLFLIHPDQPLYPVQHAIIENSTEISNIESVNTALEILVASSPLREVEAVYERLLKLIHDSKGDLKLEECVLLCTRFDEYLPLIQAVFGSLATPIPLSLLSEKPLQGIFQFFEIVIQALNDSQNWTHLMKLLELPWWRRSLGLTESNVQAIEAFHRTYPLFSRNHLEKALNLALDDHLNRDELHFSTEDAEATILWLSRLLEVADSIEERLFSKTLPLFSWGEELLAFFHTFIPPPQSKEEEIAWSEWENVCMRLLNHPLKHPFHFETAWETIQTWNAPYRAFQASPSGSLYVVPLTEGFMLTKRVVMLLGFDHRFPPQPEASPLDTRESEERELSERELCRIASLFSLLSAQQRWIASYSDAAKKTPKEMGGSLLLQDLYKLPLSIELTVIPDSRFDAARFSQAGTLGFSEDYQDALILRNKESLRQPTPLPFATPLNWGEEISLQALADFAEEPLKPYFKAKNILWSDVPELKIRPPLIPPVYEMKQMAQNLVFDSTVSDEAAFQTSGSLQASILTETAKERILLEKTALLERLEKVGAKTKLELEFNRYCKKPFETPLGKIVPAGQIALPQGRALYITGRASLAGSWLLAKGKKNFSHFLAIWPQYLFLTVQETPLEGVLFLDEGEKKLSPPQNPLIAFQRWLGFFALAQQTAIPLTQEGVIKLYEAPVINRSFIDELNLLTNWRSAPFQPYDLPALQTLQETIQLALQSAYEAWG